MYRFLTITAYVLYLSVVALIIYDIVVHLDRIP